MKGIDVPDSSNQTIPTKWEVMLPGGATNTAYEGFTPTPNEPSQGPLTGGGGAADQYFIIKKKLNSLAQLSFMALNADTGVFDVRVSGITQIGDGKFTQSPLLELTCTANTGPLLLPGTENPDIGELYRGVGTIIQIGGPDTVVLNVGTGELATVTFDPYGHEFILVDFNGVDQTMNGMYRGL